MWTPLQTALPCALLTALMVVLRAAPSAAMDEGQGWPQAESAAPRFTRAAVDPAPRLRAAAIDGLTATRAAPELTSSRVRDPGEGLARAMEPPTPGRLPHGSLPDLARTKMPEDTHAIRPTAARQATARTPRPNPRAPDGLMVANGLTEARRQAKAQLPWSPRATIDRNAVRTNRATFEDWLFGR